MDELTIDDVLVAWEHEFRSGRDRLVALNRQLRNFISEAESQLNSDPSHHGAEKISAEHVIGRIVEVLDIDDNCRLTIADQSAGSECQVTGPIDRATLNRLHIAHGYRDAAGGCLNKSDSQVVGEE